jgi:hypothetical protein
LCVALCPARGFILFSLAEDNDEELFACSDAWKGGGGTAAPKEFSFQAHDINNKTPSSFPPAMISTRHFTPLFVLSTLENKRKSRVRGE